MTWNSVFLKKVHYPKSSDKALPDLMCLFFFQITPHHQNFITSLFLHCILTTTLPTWFIALSCLQLFNTQHQPNAAFEAHSFILYVHVQSYPWHKVSLIIGVCHKSLVANRSSLPPHSFSVGFRKNSQGDDYIFLLNIELKALSFPHRDLSEGHACSWQVNSPMMSYQGNLIIIHVSLIPQIFV